MNSSKNVLQFLCFRSPYGGSFFKSLLKLEQSLKNDAVDMIYLFHENTADIPWVQGLIDEGKKIYFLSGNFYRDIFTIKKIIARHHIKYVHAHFAGTRQFSMFKIVKMLYKKNLIIIRHLRNHDKPRGLVSESLRKALNHVDLYIGCSESVAIEYRKNFKLTNDKVTYVTNAIDFNRLNKYEKLSRGDFYISSDTTVFLMFGFDYYRKGVDIVLGAMDGLVEKGHDVCLLLSLSVNREAIEQKIKDRFGEIPEWLRILKPRDDIASYYNLSDYFISAAREEGFCNALVEAAYCEKPIISSNIPGPQSLNIPHTYMFESEDVAGLQDAMLSLISLSHDKKKQIIVDQKAYVEKAFNLDEWAHQIKGIYQNLN
ncbi:glycosyltransferase family 4 protein [Mucilaginibacter sp. BT774]|uniref:glycosyltransferase family 4 protein n=1 Tax=Mucilaginibacter sp. BT774 TaxID=3062276 RepID=UPI002676CA18|nr:glycosyltransferase family 4 protein [Mucilaginibacter sp. BT774]MDO3629074.1 glycosyltransferase family 4 protein [Mucilaginibacter sp. BT774]